jgi:arylformamidase
MFRFFLLIALILPAAPVPASAFFEDWLQQRRAASLRPAATPPPLPEGARALRDLPYGEHPLQRMDVYLPPVPATGTVILFVHGGGWAVGNKDNPGNIGNKAAYWLPRGYVLVSANYRLRPDTAPLDQARDVARALAEVQRLAPEWGANPARVLLMGHSAGAHLALLVGASPTLWRDAGATRPLGVVSLDSGAVDVPDLMARPHIPPLFHRAFGDDPGDWEAASPQHRLTDGAVPMLLVCSRRRPDACPQGRALARKARALGTRVDVQAVDLSHGDVNRLLGLRSGYTERVQAFLRDLEEPAQAD